MIVGRQEGMGGQRNKSNCDVVAVKASADLTRDSEDEMALGSYRERGKRVGPFYPHVDQSLEVRCPERVT